MRTFPAIILILCVSMLPAWADEQADIKAVEDILEIEKQAIEIRKRARDRANVVVDGSSLGASCKKSHKTYKKALDDFNKSKAYREYLGDEKMKRLDYNYTSRQFDKWNKEMQRRQDAYTAAKEPVDKFMDVFVALTKQCNRMKDKVFLIFLDDEIEKAVKSKKKHLSRELKKLRTEYKSA